jgi:hypothetical protein
MTSAQCRNLVRLGKGRLDLARGIQLADSSIPFLDPLAETEFAAGPQACSQVRPKYPHG